MPSHIVVSHRANCSSWVDLRDDCDLFSLDGCLDAPTRFPSGSARCSSLVTTGNTYDHGHTGCREFAGEGFSVSPDIGDAGAIAAIAPEPCAADCLDQPGFPDGVSHGSLADPVDDVKLCSNDQYKHQKNEDGGSFVSAGQLDVHGVSSCYVSSDPKRFCPPPPVNAAGLLDGSPKAGEGAGTLAAYLASASEAFRLYAEYRDAGMRASADRQRRRCERALWSWVCESARLQGLS